MKALNLMFLPFLLFLLVGSSAAQAPQNLLDAPGVSVVKKSWRRQRHNPALNEDPFRSSQRQADLTRARAETISENNRRADVGQKPLPVPTQNPTDFRYIGPSRVRYVYEVKVKNTGTKTIRALGWDYVFSEPGTQQEVGRRQYISKVNIRPGKTKNLVMYSFSPPTSTIYATQVGKELQNQYSEQVIVQSIEYDDGSAWRRTQK